MKMQIWIKVVHDNHGNRAELPAHALTPSRNGITAQLATMNSIDGPQNYQRSSARQSYADAKDENDTY